MIGLAVGSFRGVSSRQTSSGEIAALREEVANTKEMVALSLLKDPVLDRLVTHHARFDELPQVLARLAGGDSETLCQRIDYPD